MVKRIGRFEGSVGWSKLDVFEQCAARFFWQYVYDGPRIPAPVNQAFVKGTRVHENLDQWLNGKHPAICLEAMPMRAELNHLKKSKPRTEEAWAFDEGFEPKPIGFKAGDWIRAKIDALVVMAKSAIVIDFKTGKNRGAGGEQPRFYAALTLIREPKVMTVQPEFWYLEHGKIAQGELVHRKELPALKILYKRRLMKIYEEKTWAETPGQMCHWCDFSKGRGGPCEKA